MSSTMRDFLEAWDDPDWYDLHDRTLLAGSEREPEHYREALLTLPPLGPGDHLVDVGAGTGKLAVLIAEGYPDLGEVTLIEPIAAKLERAADRIRRRLPKATIHTSDSTLGSGSALPHDCASLVTVGSVLMPALEVAEGSCEDGLRFVRQALGELKAMLRSGGELLLLETLAPPWTTHERSDAIRRLHLQEILDEARGAGFGTVEVRYRFRDRVVLSASSQ